MLLSNDRTITDAVKTMRKLVATIGHAEGMVVLVDRPGRRMGLLLQVLAAKLTSEFIVVSVRSRPDSGLDDLLDASAVAYRRDFTQISDEHPNENLATVILIEDGEVLADGTLQELARLALLAKDRKRPLRIVLTGSPELGPRVERLELSLGGMVHAQTCQIDDTTAGADRRPWLVAAAAGSVVAAGFAALILTGTTTPPQISPEAAGGGLAAEQPAAVPLPLSSPAVVEPLKPSPEAPIPPAAAPGEPAGHDLADLVARAHRQLADGRLDEPQDDNAFRTYQEIVILAPEDTAGPHLLSLIRDAYLDRARDAEQHGDADRAGQLRDAARIVTPEHAALLAASRQ
jgi:hypothetical protein